MAVPCRCLNDLETLRRELALAQVFLDRAMKMLAAAQQVIAEQKKAEEPIFNEP